MNQLPVNLSCRAEFDSLSDPLHHRNFSSYHGSNPEPMDLKPVKLDVSSERGGMASPSPQSSPMPPPQTPSPMGPPQQSPSPMPSPGGMPPPAPSSMGPPHHPHSPTGYQGPPPQPQHSMGPGGPGPGMQPQGTQTFQQHGPQVRRFDT
uniref:Uncharacterized protein n=1 Tax=Timema shepardi TaxID=629360 RepID=A0A7R9G650_TIMSH|nr:unnamed protein product [Timema shepardi]